MNYHGFCSGKCCRLEYARCAAGFSSPFLPCCCAAGWGEPRCCPLPGHSLDCQPRMSRCCPAGRRIAPPDKGCCRALRHRRKIPHWYRGWRDAPSGNRCHGGSNRAAYSRNCSAGHDHTHSLRNDGRIRHSTDDAGIHTRKDTNRDHNSPSRAAGRSPHTRGYNSRKRCNKRYSTRSGKDYIRNNNQTDHTNCNPES